MQRCQLQVVSSCISKYYSATQELSFAFVREASTAISISVLGKEYNVEALESDKTVHRRQQSSAAFDSADRMIMISS